MLFDTDFVIALSRSEASKPRQRAKAWLARHKPSNLYVSLTTWAEFAEGCAAREQVPRAFRRFKVLPMTEEVSWHPSRAARVLKGAGLYVGDNDAWIAGTALAYGLRVVTGNDRHFTRVPGLKVETF